MSKEVRCCDGCGSSVPDVSAAQANAWSWLSISRRYRCPECTKRLAEVNVTDAQVAGMDSTIAPL